MTFIELKKDKRSQIEKPETMPKTKNMDNLPVKMKLGILRKSKTRKRLQKSLKNRENSLIVLWGQLSR